MKIRSAIFFMLLAAFSPSAMAAAPAREASEKVITNVSSESMIYNSAAQQVTFSGKVKVTHPDFTLNSDKLILYLNSSGSSRQQGAEGRDAGVVQRIVAESKVSINLPEGRVATCNKATYSVENETLTMEGSPALSEGSNRIRGDKMIFYLRESRNEVQGRVEVDFVSGSGQAGFGDVGTGNAAGGDN